MESEDATLKNFDALKEVLGPNNNVDDDQIRQALNQTNNNVEQAAQLLFQDTDINAQGSYDDDMEIVDAQAGSVDSDHDSTTVTYSLEDERMKDVDEEVIESQPSPREDVFEETIHSCDHENALPPAYEDVVDRHHNLPSTNMESSFMEEAVKLEEEVPPPAPAAPAPSSSSNIEFPLTHFYELEGRVHTDQWSIPYKREESLGKCMLAAVAMMKEEAGVAEADENCVKFLEKTMPCAFDKLLTHDAVYRWDDAIMKGIRDMLHILIDLICARLTYKPIPCYLLNLLSVAFTADIAFHNRNRARRINPSYWHQLLGEDRVLALMPSFTTRKEPKGWLVEMMNLFAQHGGIKSIKDAILSTEKLTLQELTALFHPFSNCDDYINPSVFKFEMTDCMDFALKYVEKLSDDHLKDKEVGCVFDLLKNLRTLLRRCNIHDAATEVDTIRLDTTLRMFKIPHFNAKMNALKEVVKLTEEPFSAARAGVKNPIPPERVKRWLIENKVLSIAFGGNLHQAQYCDKVKSIVEFLGTELSTDELSTMWDMQVDKNPAQVENIHVILAYAASRFTPHQLDHLFHLIQESWDSVSSDRYREKLLELIGKIGKDDRTGKTATKILELLWQLAHSPQLSREMVELALNSHCAILIDSIHIRDSEKRVYLNKCIDDIKKGQAIVASLRQLHRLAKGMFCSNHGHKDQQQISDIQKQYDLLRLVSATLNKLHARTVQMCKENKVELSGETVADGRYTLAECVDCHLQFMGFLLQDGALYLPTKRASEIWDTLVANPDACASDRTLAFKWFDMGINDLELDTQLQMFNKRVLKVDPAVLDLAGYHCIRNFFETINLAERKIKRVQSSQQLIIDNPDLTGIEYLWKAALEIKDSSIADQLIDNILQISYSALSHRLKKDPAVLHKRFMDECFTRLETLVNSSDEANIATELKVLSIERLVLLAQRYITTVEESHPYPRQIPPHGSCFKGDIITLEVTYDQTTFKMECNSNESLLSVRQNIAKELKCNPEQLQLGTSDKWLVLSHQLFMLVHQLDFSDNQKISVRNPTATYSGYSEVGSACSTDRKQAALKQEKLLPGVMMAAEKDVFAKLEQLCETGNSQVICAVRSLLKLIPINQSVLDALQVFINPSPDEGTEDSNSPIPTPQEVLREFYDTSKVSQTQLLYNLEVLSGKLMPINTSVASNTSSQVFRRTFLEAGGLNYVINVLQKNTFSSSTDLFVRQDCYAVALSLASYLLCALPSQETALNNLEIEEVEDVQPSQEFVPQRQHSRSLTVDYDAARLTIETMSVEDFSTTLACLMRVCWAASAGQLHLVSSSHEEEEGTEGEMQTFKLGICGQNKTVTAKDIGIARESLALLTMCLKSRRSLIKDFYSLPLTKECIVDILLGSASSDIRSTLLSCFHDLCTETSPTSDASDTSSSFEEPLHAKGPSSASIDSPQHFFLHLLLSHPSCLWETTTSCPGDLQVWHRSSQYFEFISLLLMNTSSGMQLQLGIDVQQLLQKELSWLNDVVISQPSSPEVQTLLAGHLNLCKSIISCEGIDKESLCHNLISRLLSEFLFPTTNLTLDSPSPHHTGIVTVNPKCCSAQSRVAAYNLLVELSKNCYENLHFITQQLVNMHHRDQPQSDKDWEIRPLVEGRSNCGYVGLKNGGATCYMNAVLQQLFVQPGIESSILSVEKVEEEEENEGEKLLHEVQIIFGHLLESRLQYYCPETFWKTFKIEGQPVNVHEHQDASEFFSNLTDRVDEALKKRGQQMLFQKRFGGVFLDQIICHGCDHNYDKEQCFTTLQLPVVQSKSLTESLHEFVRGDMLEGDNRYFCEKCEEKRDTLKRTCIKTLPPALVVHLKRFDYDWETNREVKFNNYFEFPWMLDMEPYTVRGITAKENGIESDEKQLFELTGIIVHQGHASAGHYYAFIKDKRRSTVTSKTIVTEKDATEASPVERWLKFNDTLVEEFDLNDSTLESECFGGALKTTNPDSLQGSHPDSRVRHWNAYMLFYEAVSTSSEGSCSMEGPSPPSSPSQSKLTQIPKEEHRDLLSDKMPPQIQKSVNKQNLQFMQNRDVYCEEYFDFVHHITFCNASISNDAENESSSKYGGAVIELAVKFLIRTYFKTFRELRVSHKLWVKDLEQLLKNCKSASEWFIHFIATPSGLNHLKPFLLESISKEVRHDFCTIFGHAMQSCCSFNGLPAEKDHMDTIITQVLKMLEKEVVDNVKNCSEYFMFLKIYATNQSGCHHLLSKNAFDSVIQFLFGSSSDSAQRRWTSLQVKEFGSLYVLLSLLIRNTNFSVFETEFGPEEVIQANPYMIPSKQSELVPASECMHQTVYKLELSRKFIRECVLALRESDVIATEAIGSMLCYCSWNNQSFSACVIEDLQSQVYSVPSNELKSYFKVLTEILVVEDRLQQKRISFALVGGKYKPDIALFDTINPRSISTDTKRTYQGIKFLVGLANRSPKAQEYLLNQPDRLQNAVSWLRKKVNEYNWTQSSTYSNESSSSRTFQRTISAVNTLEEASALLSELEARDSRQAATMSSSSQEKVIDQTFLGDKIEG